MGLPISTNWKDESYDTIFIIIDQSTKMVYYKPMKVTINTLTLAKVIIDMVVRYHSLPDTIISDEDFVFTSKF